LLGYWIHGFLRVLIGYGPSSVWAMTQPSSKIFSFEHGQGEKTKKNKNKNLSFTL
jgi:hypothetical protein